MPRAKSRIFYIALVDPSRKNMRRSKKFYTLEKAWEIVDKHSFIFPGDFEMRVFRKGTSTWNSLRRRKRYERKTAYEAYAKRGF